MAISTPSREFLGYAIAQTLVGKTIELRAIASGQSVDPLTADLATCIAAENTSDYTPGSAVVTGTGAFDGVDSRWEIPPIEIVMTAGSSVMTFDQLFVVVKDATNGDKLLYATNATANAYSIPPSTEYIDSIEISLGYGS